MRRRADLTQAELARRVGTTQSAIARWERRAVSPSVATMRRLAEACDHRLAVVAVPEPEAIDDADAARLAANLRMTPARRLDRAATAANFVLRGRRAMSAARRTNV